MNKLIPILAISLLNVGCATYMQALNSSNGNGIVLYNENTDPVELCKMYFNKWNKYPETTNYWNIDYSESQSTIFLTGTFRMRDGSLNFKTKSCIINWWTFENETYLGIKGENTFTPVGPAIGWSNGAGKFTKYN